MAPHRRDAQTGNAASIDTVPEFLRVHLVRNVGIIFGVHICWGFGAAFISTQSLLPVFLSKLGASPLWIGALPALWIGCTSAPQLLTARFTRHLPVRKYVFAPSHYPGLFAMFVLGALALTAPHHTALLRTATLAAVCLYGLTLSVASPMWTNLVAKLVPDKVRGTTFGTVFTLGNLSGAIGAAIAYRVLDRLSFPENFGWLFLTAPLLMIAAVSAFFFLCEPAVPPSATAEEPFLRDLWRQVRRRPDFGRLLCVRQLIGLGTMGAGFTAVAGVERFSLGGSAAAIYGALFLAAQVVASVAAGSIGDRRGFKAVVCTGTLIQALAYVVAFAAHAPDLYLGVFVLSGIANACNSVAFTNLAIEYCAISDRTGFIAASNAVTAPVLIAGPLLGGLLAEHTALGYNVTFALSCALNLAAFVALLLFVRDPRRRSAAAPPTSRASVDETGTGA